jgi:hypothetical protein
MAASTKFTHIQEWDRCCSHWHKAFEVCDNCVENVVCNTFIWLSYECVQRII